MSSFSIALGGCLIYIGLMLMLFPKTSLTYIPFFKFIKSLLLLSSPTPTKLNKTLEFKARHSYGPYLIAIGIIIIFVL